MVSSSTRRPFEFVANHIVLDFVNTVNARPTFTRDDLRSSDDVADWASEAGVVSGNRQMRRDRRVDSQLATAVALREELYAVFGPIAAGGDPLGVALTSVIRRAADGVPRAEWSRGGRGYEPVWRVSSIAALCDRLADDAVQLLRSPAVLRIRACDGCGWLFIDTSRAHVRRWCSMSACGARHKMRRYHQRRANAGAPS
jgi:predicted RNA-binding Zn ribbon-like protein